MVLVGGLTVGSGLSFAKHHWRTAVQYPATDPALLNPRISIKLQKNISVVGVTVGTVGAEPFGRVFMSWYRARNVTNKFIFDV